MVCANEDIQDEIIMKQNQIFILLQYVLRQVEFRKVELCLHSKWCDVFVLCVSTEEYFGRKHTVQVKYITL